MDRQLLWAPTAWLAVDAPQRWVKNVLCESDANGFWSSITPNVSLEQAQQQGATIACGGLLPGVANTHSHAFQRAFAGLAERRYADHDDFWSWRDRMYRVALAISPQQLKAVAAQLYLEMLRGGYTHVCEFHYLHHVANGVPYDDALTMSWMLIEAARDVGIGLTLLPVLYERSGFAATTLRDDQRRFATDTTWVLNAQRRIAHHAAGSALLNAGVAIHSLRAVNPASIHALANAARGPIHIHIAEQTAEVEACIKLTGMRPVQWLAGLGLLDARWQLVHATHVTPEEIERVAKSGAGVVLCPTTEANLGDGATDLVAWLASGTALSIGSDSHVARDWREELRLAEYGQRLLHRSRNVSADPKSGQTATAERLFARVVAGGAAAAGHVKWGLAVGARADAVVVNSQASALLGMPETRMLDALVFSSPTPAFDDVMVAGRWAIRAGKHAAQDAIQSKFVDAMNGLWAEFS